MSDAEADSSATTAGPEKSSEEPPQVNGAATQRKRKISREKYPAVNLHRLVSLRQENTKRSQPSIYNRDYEIEKMNIFKFTESNIILHSKRKRKLLSDKSSNSIEDVDKAKRLQQKKKTTFKEKKAKESKKRKAMIAAISEDNSSQGSKKKKVSPKENSQNSKAEAQQSRNNASSKTTSHKKKLASKVQNSKSQDAITDNKLGRKTVFRPVIVRTSNSGAGKITEKNHGPAKKPLAMSKNGLLLLNSPTSPGSPRIFSDSSRQNPVHNRVETKPPLRTGYAVHPRDSEKRDTSSHIYCSRVANRFSMLPKFEEINVKHFEVGYVHIALCPKKEQRYHFNPLDPDDDEILTKTSMDRQKASPAIYNCLTPSMLDELITALEGAQESPCKAVLLSSVGSVFSAGFDLRYFTYYARSCDKECLMEAVELIRKFVDVLIHFPKPIVVAVQGPAIGLAASMLFLCDLVLADVKASFHFPYTQQGLSPDCCASYTLPTLLKPAMANALLYGNRALTPTEARDHGIVSEVVPHDSFMRHVIPRVRDVCSSAAVSLTATKRLMRARQMAHLVYANECESRSLRKCLSTPECLRTMLAYVNNHLV